MRALVTGAGGFAGRHLVAHLRSAGHDVTATARAPREGEEALDVADRAACEAALARARPDAVFHLAALTAVPHAEREREAALRANVGGTLALLEACEAKARGAAVIVASSGQIYRPATGPIAESAPLAPESFYGITKQLAETVALHFAANGLRVVVARPFNHVGPGQRDDFALASFARQIADAERAGREAALRVGNLSPIRDFLDGRDVVRAYRALAERGAAGEVYNVCSGVGSSVRAMLDGLVRRARVAVKVEVDPARLRAHDAPSIVGDPSKLRAATGWTPEIPLERTLDDLMADARLRAGG